MFLSSLFKLLRGFSSLSSYQALNSSGTYYFFPSYNSLLNSCSTIIELKKLHARIVVDGFGQSLSLTTKLISLVCGFSNIDYARKLFDRMPERDVFLWNTLIRGYADLGPCEEAVILYQQMHLLGLSPDHFTFPFVVRSCGVSSALREGKEIHCTVIKNGFYSSVFVQSSLVSMYSQNGIISDATLIFNDIIVKNVVSWTTMISGYMQNGFVVEAIQVFRKMIDSIVQPNSITLVSVLPACARLELLGLGQSIHGYSLKLGVDLDVPLTNALIGMYGKCNNIKIARFLFDEMPLKNLSSWNSMIGVYEQNGHCKEAIRLFRRLLNERVKFDHVTLVSIISACANLGALNIGKWVHKFATRNGLESNSSITNAFIDMYSKCGSLDLARDVFDNLHQKSVVSWTAMIGAYAAHGHGPESLELFSKMRENGVHPNSFTFTTILTACRHSGLVEEGRKLYNSMIEQFSLEPRVEQCACMVDLLGRAGLLKEAYDFIKCMPIKPDADVWGALLGSCRIYGDIRMAELVVNRLLKLDSRGVTFHVLMSNIYAEAGRWEDALRLRTMMKSRELKKVPGHSSVEVNQKLYTFHSGPRIRRISC